jgi:hypothetical protein
MSLNESMIAELLPVMKFRIKFMKLLAGLKQTQQQEPSVSEVPSTSIAATIPSTPLVATVQTSSVVATSASIGERVMSPVVRMLKVKTMQLNGLQGIFLRSRCRLH